MVVEDMAPAPAPAGSYPVNLSVERPAKQSRLTNFPLGIGLAIRIILLIPHFVVLYFFGIFAAIVYLVAQFAILFSGKYPAGMFNLVNGYVRWTANISGYQTSLYDKYPAFSIDADPAYPLQYDAAYPASSSKVLNFPILAGVIRGILVIPHYLVLLFLGIAVFIAVLIAKFAILFTGSFPEGLYRFCVGYSRWSIRTTAYTFGLTDRYPPFGMD